MLATPSIRGIDIPSPVTEKKGNVTSPRPRATVPDADIPILEREMDMEPDTGGGVWIPDPDTTSLFKDGAPVPVKDGGVAIPEDDTVNFFRDGARAGNGRGSTGTGCRDRNFIQRRYSIPVKEGTVSTTGQPATEFSESRSGRRP